MIVDELEKCGLISRDRAATDRRAYALKPTLSGQALCKWATEAVNGHEQRVFGGLSAKERQQFLTILAKIELGSK
jgi:DNA-binding MarR family transcriptional regulator